MSLSALDEVDLSIVLLQTPSNMMRIFVQDKIKEKHKNTNDSTFNIQTKKDFKESVIKSGVQPFGATKWLFLVDTAKLKLSSEDIKEIVKNNSSGVYLIFVDKYSDYKRIKKAIGTFDGFVDFYITRLRRNDFLYLYDYYVPEDNKLTKALYDQVIQSYSNDLDAVFKLFKALKSGEKVENQRDLTAICGVGGNTVENYMLSLLKDPPTTERGTNTVLRNRIKLGVDLGSVYGYSNFWSYAMNCTKSFSDIKMLVISGVVYKRIQKLPDCYNEKRLGKMNRYLWKLKEVPYSSVIRLRYMLSRRKWRNESDFLAFIYNYYYADIKEAMKNDIY